LVHAGEEAAALELAKKTIDAFEGTNVDAIVSNAAGCGSNVKDYAYLLRDDPSYADRARSFSAKCKDISEILANLEPRAARHPLKLRVAFHDSCHLQHTSVRSHTLFSRKSPPSNWRKSLNLPRCVRFAGIYNPSSLTLPMPLEIAKPASSRH
jgi:glycolate oxidase iron-sulfur subunit